jgi:hypothetical protein
MPVARIGAGADRPLRGGQSPGGSGYGRGCAEGIGRAGRALDYGVCRTRRTGRRTRLVHFACAREGRETTHREEHFGDIGRGGVRLAALEVALELMISAVT